MDSEYQITDWFWTIINEAHGDPDRLRNLLKRLDQPALVDFRSQFDLAVADLTDEPFLAYIGDLSEDSKRDIAEWVVSRGREYYDVVCEQPERIPLRPGKEPNLSVVVDQLYLERHDDVIPYPEDYSET